MHLLYVHTAVLRDLWLYSPQTQPLTAGALLLLLGFYAKDQVIPLIKYFGGFCPLKVGKQLITASLKNYIYLLHEPVCVHVCMPHRTHVEGRG